MEDRNQIRLLSLLSCVLLPRHSVVSSSLDLLAYSPLACSIVNAVSLQSLLLLFEYDVSKSVVCRLGGLLFFVRFPTKMKYRFFTFISAKTSSIFDAMLITSGRGSDRLSL